jgi:hypothetical protein
MVASSQESWRSGYAIMTQKMSIPFAFSPPRYKQVELASVASSLSHKEYQKRIVR